MVLRLFLFLLLLPALSSVSVSHAAESQASETPAPEIQTILAKNEIILADLFRLAELASPDLLAAKHAVSAEASRARQAGLYPNPTLDFEVGEMSVNNPDDRKEKVALVQPLILGGRRGAAVDAAQAHHESAVHQSLNVRRNVLFKVQTLWAEQLHYQEMDTAFLDLLAVANGTLEIAQTRFEARAAPESQVTRALLDVYDLQVAQQEHLLDRATGKAELKAVFGGLDVPVDRFVSWEEDTPAELKGLLQLEGLTEHPAQAAARQGVAAAEASLHQAEAARIPDLDVFLAYGRNRGADENFIEAGVSFPLPIFDRNQGLIAANHSEVARTRAQARVVDSELEVRLLVASQRYQNAHDQLEISAHRILPAAERGLSQAQDGYRVGHVPFLELIDAQRTLATVRIRTLELRRDIHIVEAELMSLAGAGPYGE